MTNTNTNKLNDSYDITDQIMSSGLWSPGNPLRLHLGCGQKHFHGYINVDYPPTEHTVQDTTVADIYANIIHLNFPDRTVDEVRLHHVFEHFDRPTALALLCKWYMWLKPGGTLTIETPDFNASIDLMRSDQCSYMDKQLVLRHLFGSHEAGWAMHLDGWYEDKFRNILDKLGFGNINTRFSGRRMIRNITVSVTKVTDRTCHQAAQAAKVILWDSVVDDSQCEKMQWVNWCELFDDLFKCPKDLKPGKLQQLKSEPETAQQERLRQFQSDYAYPG